MGRGRGKDPRAVLLNPNGPRVGDGFRSLMSSDDPRLPFVSYLESLGKPLDGFFETHESPSLFFSDAKEAAESLKAKLVSLEEQLKAGKPLDSFYIAWRKEAIQDVIVIRRSVERIGDSGLQRKLDGVLGQLRLSEGKGSDFLKPRKKKIVVSDKVEMIELDVEGEKKKVPLRFVKTLHKDGYCYANDDIYDKLLHKMKKYGLVNGPHEGEFWATDLFKKVYRANEDYLDLL